MELLRKKVTRSVKLHPYQQDFVDKVTEAWVDFKRVLACLAVGGGKTICAGELIAREVEKGGRCLVLAHTIDLCSQFQRSLEKNYGLWCSMDGGGYRSEDSDVVISTVQSMSNSIEKGRFNRDDWSLCVIDEAHRSHGGQHKKAIEYFSCKWLGVTATPVRTDKKDLMQIFESMPFDLPITELIRDGFLSRIEIINAPVEIKLESTASRGGDYKEEEIGAALDPSLSACAEAYAKHGVGKCGIIFLPLVRTSKKFVSLLKENGIKAAHVDGETPTEERLRIQAMLEMGEIDAACCSLLWSEGWDCRPVNLMMNLRCTKSWSLQTQMIGRITRTYDPDIHGPKGTRWKKKDGSAILDVTWMVDDYNMLQRPSSLLAKDDDEANEIERKIKQRQANGKKADLMDVMDEVVHEREERLKARLEAVKNRKARMLSCEEFFARIHLPDFADYEPLNEIEARPIKGSLTQKQHDWIVKSKFDLESIKNYGQARKILDALGQRAKEGKATLAQVKFAESLDYQGKTGKDPYEASFEDMKAFLDGNAPAPKPWMKWKKR